MKLIDLPTPPPESIGVQIARSEITRLNNAFLERVDLHKSAFTRFWDGVLPPDEILASMRDLGAGVDVAYIDMASESYRHLATMAGTLGKDINDFIPPAFYEPRRQISIIDGAVTLAPPAEGYDAWGRLIPPPVDPADLPPGFPGLP